MSDPRVEAVARIIREGDVLPGNLVPPLDDYIGDAQQALINADRADREQGIHRVRVDDVTVERVAEFLYDEAETGGAPWAEYLSVGSSYCEVWRDKARTVLRIVRGIPRDIRSGQ